MESLRGLKVKLNLDLTRYRSGLVRGITGYIVDPSYKYSFYLIDFPSINYKCPIINESVTIIDKKYVEEQLNSFKTSKKY